MQRARHAIDALFDGATPGGGALPDVVPAPTSALASPTTRAIEARLRELQADSGDVPVEGPRLDDFTDLLMRFAESASRDGDAGRAIAAVERVVALRRARVDATATLEDRARLCSALLGAANLHLAGGDAAAAAAALGQADGQLRLAPEDDEMWRARGVALHRMQADTARMAGDTGAAVRALRNALARMPDHAGHPQGADVCATRLQLIVDIAAGGIASGDLAGAEEALDSCAPLLVWLDGQLPADLLARMRATVLRLQGVAAARRGQVEAAQAAYAAALAALRGIDEPGLRAAIASGWQELCDAHGLDRSRELIELVAGLPAPGTAGSAASCCGGGSGGFACSCAQ